MGINEKVVKRQKLDWSSVKENDKVAAISIAVRKGENMFIIMVSRDKDVVLNFGSEHWINFMDLFEYEDEIDNQDYQNFIENNEDNYEETREVIETAEDFTEVAGKFYDDFRTDRGNRIRIDLVEGETEEEAEKLKEAFGGKDE